jgi:hypothetical protein
MTSEDLWKLKEFQQTVFKGIEEALYLDGAHKHYEGAIRVCLPSYFGGDYFIELDCYVLGPGRHYEWAGETLSIAIDQALADVKRWIKELDNES